MTFYYGYISGTYMHDMKHVGMLPTFRADDIMKETYLANTEESKLGDYGLDKGWSSVIADKVDIDLTVVANPVRTVMEFLLAHKWEQAKYMIDNMFASNVGLQTVAIACCDYLMKFDNNGAIHDFLCENIPLFRTTLMQRTAFLLRKQEIDKREKKKERRKEREARINDTK